MRVAIQRKLSCTHLYTHLRPHMKIVTRMTKMAKMAKITKITKLTKVSMMRMKRLLQERACVRADCRSTQAACGGGG